MLIIKLWFIWNLDLEVWSQRILTPPPPPYIKWPSPAVNPTNYSSLPEDMFYQWLILSPHRKYNSSSSSSLLTDTFEIDKAQNSQTYQYNLSTSDNIQ